MLVGFQLRSKWVKSNFALSMYVFFKCQELLMADVRLAKIYHSRPKELERYVFERDAEANK